MRRCNFVPILAEDIRQNCHLHPSIAVPGLALTMEQILARNTAGTIGMTEKAHKELYETPDKHISDYSPDVSRYTLAERAEVIRELTRERERLSERISEAKEAERAQKEAELRAQIRKEEFESIKLSMQQPLQDS